MDKISTLLKSAFLSAALFMASTNVNAEVLLSENFDTYTAGNLIGQGSWVAKGSHTADPIQLATPSLTYTGYSEAATGNSIKLYTTSSAGEDGKLKLGTPKVLNNGESAYISILVRPNSVAYEDGISLMTSFFTLMSGSNDDTEMIHLHAIPGTDATKVKFSIGRGEAKKNYSNQAVTTKEYNINETHLIVIKYTAVDGDTNDQVEIFINPALDSEPTADAVCNSATDNMSSELGTNGIKGIQLRQHAKYNASCPDITVDAIKVFTSWSDLKADTGDPEPPVETPTITTDPTEITATIPSDAAPQEHTIKIKAKNITSDISVTVTGTNAASVAVTPATITPDQLADDKEVAITLTITPVIAEAEQTCHIEFATTGLATPHKVQVTWTVQPVYDNLAKFVEAGTYAYGTISNDLSITAVEPSADGSIVYLQDESKGLKTMLMIFDGTDAQYVQGAHISGATLSEGEGTYYLLGGTIGAVTGTAPKTVATADIETPAPADIYRLVKIENANFSTTNTTFSSKQEPMTADGKTFNVRPMPGSDLIGTNIPAADKTLNITGILTPGFGGKYYLQMRNLADIEEQAPTQPEETDELLLNAGFETSKTTIFATEFEEWDIPLGGATAETSDKVEGNQAMRIEYKSTNSASLSQDIFTYPDYPTEGATYTMRIRYKILSTNATDTLSIDSYWQHRTDGALNNPGDHDRDILYVQNIKGSDWTTKEIETTCPAGATKFTFRLTITKGMVVLFDDFSFTRKAATEPSLFVTYQPQAVKADIGDTAYLSDFIVDQALLTSDISVYLTGKDRDQFFVKPETIPAADGTTVVKVGFAPKTIGQKKGTVTFETSNHIALTKSFHFTATAIDPQALPTISINPTTLPEFKAMAGTVQTAELTLTSSSCIAPIDLKITHQENEGFIINGSQFPQNQEVKVVITFRPGKEGNYRSTLTITSESATPVTITLTGTATASTTPTDTVTKDFHFNWTAPLSLLNETFDDVTHNTALKIDGWQNVVPEGKRPWWGFEHKDAQDVVTERSAKATTYDSQQESNPDTRGTLWLTTPVLDYKNAKGKILTMRFMGDFMFEGNTTKMTVWLIDSVPGDPKPTFREIEGLGIPQTPDFNKEWSEVHVNLDGQDVSDAFAIGFKYDGVIGEDNSVIYYVDDVSWGRTDLPVLKHDSAKIEMIAPVSTKTTSGVVTVSGENLINNITLKLGGANPSNFKLSHETLPAEGGQFTVTFESDKEGVHEAYIKLSSRGAADTYIPMAVLCKSDITATQNVVMENVSTWTDAGSIHIASPVAVAVSIYSVTGQCLDSYLYSTDITTTPLPAGTYILRITDGQRTEHRKISL